MHNKPTEHKIARLLPEHQAPARLTSTADGVEITTRAEHVVRAAPSQAAAPIFCTLAPCNLGCDHAPERKGRGPSSGRHSNAAYANPWPRTADAWAGRSSSSTRLNPRPHPRHELRVSVGQRLNSSASPSTSRPCSGAMRYSIGAHPRPPHPRSAKIGAQTVPVSFPPFASPMRRTAGTVATSTLGVVARRPSGVGGPIPRTSARCSRAGALSSPLAHASAAPRAKSHCGRARRESCPVQRVVVDAASRTPD